jgi:hypothetical protein
MSGHRKPLEKLTLLHSTIGNQVNNVADAEGCVSLGVLKKLFQAQGPEGLEFGW